MPKMKRRITAAVLLSYALAAQACSGNASPSTLANGTTSATSAAVPNPFTVVNTFTPESLGHGLEHILSLAVGPDRALYVTDVSQQVAVISAQGEVLRQWGSRGSGPGEFRFVPHDPSDPFDILAKIAVAPDGTVYVTDYGNHRIQAFSPEGDFLDVVGSFGTGEGQLVDPNDPVVDEQGNLFVADDKLGMISKFSQDGRFIWRVGGADGEVDPKTLSCGAYPGNMDAHGRLVVENGCGWVLYVNGDSGRVVDSFYSGTCDATVDAAGYTYSTGDVDGCRRDLTRVFDREHRLVGEWSGPDNPIEWPPRFDANGDAFAVGVDGSIIRLSVSLPEA